MNIILLSGGSGKRLWPLSNEVRSKQFLKVIKNKNCKVESMLQRVHSQLEEAGLDDNIVIATSVTQQNSIKNQLGSKVSIVVEPERRNTFPAIALSCAYLALERKCREDEVVVVLPVDPYVSTEYYKTIYQLEKEAKEHRADIILMGVTPTYPSEKYGYIIPEKKGTKLSPVLEFKEKPSLEVAENFIKEGGLWNCGVFAFQLGYVLKEIKKRISFSYFQDIVEQYHQLENISFDYEIVEKADSVAVVSYEGEWKDLGTWNTLTEVMEEKTIGNIRLTENCSNTHVINELEIPMVVMGAHNMIVVASPDGILVADKEQSSYIKKEVEDIHQRPMFEEREWGEYKVLDLAINEDGTKSLTKRKIVKKGAEIEYQCHKNRAEVWTVLSGKCIVTINDRAHEALAGDTFSIAEGIKHGLRAVSDTEILEVQVGKELLEDGTELSIRTS